MWESHKCHLRMFWAVTKKFCTVVGRRDGVGIVTIRCGAILGGGGGGVGGGTDLNGAHFVGKYHPYESV